MVLGGSLAGLLAARVLSDHFEQVTLIERDAYPDTLKHAAEFRRRITSTGCWLRGRQILEELFPGLQDEMVAAGAPLVDMANEIAWFTRAGWGVRFPSDLKVLAFTRPLLDLHVRRRLAENPKVEILDNTDVCVCFRTRQRIVSRACSFARAYRSADRRVAKELRAIWLLMRLVEHHARRVGLNDLGYEPPEEIVIDAHLGYASRLYRIPENFDRRLEMRIRAVRAAGTKARRDSFQG